MSHTHTGRGVHPLNTAPPQPGRHSPLLSFLPFSPSAAQRPSEDTVICLSESLHLWRVLTSLTGTLTSAVLGHGPCPQGGGHLAGAWAQETNSYRSDPVMWPQGGLAGVTALVDKWTPPGLPVTNPTGLASPEPLAWCPSLDPYTDFKGDSDTQVLWPPTGSCQTCNGVKRLVQVTSQTAP